MLSYKNWKTFNESIGSTFVLGVKQPQNIGVVGANGSSEEDKFSEFDIALEEAKKKMKKKMNGEMGGGEPNPEAPEAPEEEEKVKKKRPPEDASPEEGGEEGDEGDDHEEKESPDEEAKEKEIEPDEEAKEKPTLFQKKKQKAKMKKEDVDFWNSLQKMLHGGLPSAKFRDGTNGFSEDALLAPIDINKAVTEVGPGEPGFSPNTRIGGI